MKVRSFQELEPLNGSGSPSLGLELLFILKTLPIASANVVALASCELETGVSSSAGSRCAYVTSHNTPVTLLTNFRLVPGHAVTSFTFQDSRNLGFTLELGCKAPNTTGPDIIIAPSHFRFFRITEDSYPRPYLLL